MAPFLIVAVTVLVVIALILARKAEHARQAALREWGLARGFTYTPVKDRVLAKRLQFLDRLRLGSNRYAFDVLEGTWEGVPSQAFTYHYETHSSGPKGQQQTQHHYLAVLTSELPATFPELRIYPETLLGKLGQALGLADIDFESAEFSSAFTVKSRDKRFAWDYCHGATMEYLLAHPDTALELEGDVLAVFEGGRLKPDNLAARLEHLHRLRGFLPAYLLEERTR